MTILPLLFFQTPLYVTQRRKTVLSLTESFVKQTCGSRPPSHSDIHMKKVRDNAVWITDLMMHCITVYQVLIHLSLYPVFVLFDLSLWARFVGVILLIGLYELPHRLIDPEGLLFLVQIVAWLHDVNDHKYSSEDSSLYPNLISFLDKITNKEDYVNMYQDVFLPDSPYAHLFTTKMILALTERISFSRQKKSQEQRGSQDWLEVLGWYGTLVRNIVSDADKFEAIGKDGIIRCAQYTVEVFEKTGKIPTRSAITDAVIVHYHEKLKLLASPQYMKTFPGLGYAMCLDRQMKQQLTQMSYNATADPKEKVSY